MKEPDIRNILADHEKRILALESIQSQSKKPSPTEPKNSSLTDLTLNLREEGFFSQPQTAESTWREINKKYACESNRVAMALLRLAEKRKLRRVAKVINDKEFKAYTW